MGFSASFRKTETSLS